MPDIVLDLLKYVFLAVLYIFIARAVRTIVLELRPPEEAGTAAGRHAKRKPGKIPRRAVVVEGDGLKGSAYDLSDELIIGRADKCHVVLEDNYVSQVHARIFSRGDGFFVEDLGSTNGTYLNRRRVSSPTEVQRGDRIKIGKTVLELRK